MTATWTHGAAQADLAARERACALPTQRSEPSAPAPATAGDRPAAAWARVEAPPRRGMQAAWSQVGHATYYHDGMHGRRTSSGERYDRTGLTAAHRTLPLGTWVRVTNLFNRKSVTVRVNDRGPFARGRSIDLSRAAASALDYRARGTAPVRIEVLDAGSGAAPNRPATGLSFGRS